MPKAAFHTENRFPSFVYLFSSALAIVAVTKSAIGAFFPEIFRDPPISAGNAQGTDIVILAVGIPALVISMILTARGSWRAQIVWLGSLCYIFYNSVIFAFDTAFNPLFLLYVTTLSLSLWSILVLLIHFDVEKLRDRFTSKLPVKVFAIYMIILAGLFLFAWLSQIVPALFEASRPIFLQGTNMLTSPVHILDLGFALPLVIISAAWLWQRKSWGYLVSGALLSMLTIETASVAVDQVFGSLRDPSATMDAVPMFLVLTVVGLVVTVYYLRFLGLSSSQTVHPA